MNRIDLISREGNFYKANLHAHCTCSDGKLTPAQAKELYKAHGYSIYAYTDHNVLYYHKELNDPDFLVLCGYELDAYRMGKPFWKTCHLCAIARDPDHAVYVPKPAGYNTESINETIVQLRKANYFVTYNHPGWSAEEPGDYLPLEGVSAMEVYNHGCEVLTNDGDGKRHYEIALKNGKKWFCIAADDNHNDECLPGHEDDESDACGGWTMIKASSLTYGNIMHALDTGDFYCSSGPELYDYYLEDGILCVNCSPVKGVYLKSDYLGASRHIVHKTDDITHAEFDLRTLKRGECFLRLELVTSNGKTAWTNPYFPGDAFPPQC